MAEYIEREALMVALCKEIVGDGDYCNGKDMVLTEEQAQRLADFISEYQPYYTKSIYGLVTRALLHGNKVVINADW